MATIKNYFSSRITIGQVRNHIGASPIQTIQRLNGLTIVELPWSMLPGYSNVTPGNVATNTTPFFKGKKYEITMNTDFSNQYTGSSYIQDPDVSPVGISIPPTGTIGYFAKDAIPDGWLEIGNDMEYYVFRRQINGDWFNPIYANTEYTAIHSLLKDWGFVKSESRNITGWSFNTNDPFKGYFIRCFNPAATGADSGYNIFDTQNSSYLSIHQHDGAYLYSSSVGSSTPLTGDLHPIDFGYRIKRTEIGIPTIGQDIWFNYKWKPGVEWEIVDSGTVKLTSGSENNLAEGHRAAAENFMDYANHIHGSIETYYRGYNNNYFGKLTYLHEPFTSYVASGRSQATLLRSNSPAAGSSVGVLDLDQNNTFYNPYSPYPGNVARTYYTDAIQTFTQSYYLSASYTATHRHSHTTDHTHRHTQDHTADVATYSVSSPPFRSLTSTQTSTHYVGHTHVVTHYNTLDTPDVPSGGYTQTYNIITETGAAGFEVRGPAIVYTELESIGKFYPYHILKSDPITAQGSEFYNSGDNGTFVEVTSEEGDHAHDYTFIDGTGPITKFRGQGHENRPVNVALRMCIKY